MDIYLNDEKIDKPIEMEDLDTKNRRMKPWQTKEWKEKREKIISQVGKCQYPGCNETENLAIHHPKHPNTKHLWGGIAYALFLDSSEFQKLPYKKREVCPRCESGHIYERKTKTPKYRCLNCQFEFFIPKIINTAHKENFREAFQRFKKANEEKITEIRKNEGEKRWNEYMYMENVQVLCKKHHFVVEKELVPCSKCGKFIKPNREGLCFNCLIAEGFLKKCPICGENYYNPKFYDKCASCREHEWMEQGAAYDDEDE